MDIDYQKRFFNSASHQYDKRLLAHPPLYVREEIALLMGSIPQGANEIVDFGCGTGRLTIPLLRAGYRVLGVDISEKSLHVLQDNIRELVPRKISHFSYAYKLSAVKKKVKVLVGTDILHHVSLSDTVQTIAESLLPGGYAIFSEPNAWNIAWYIFLSVFIDWEAEKGVMHCSRYNLQNMFKKAGFKEVHFTPHALLPPIFFEYIPLLQRINYAVASFPILNLFSYRFIIVAKK